MQTERVIYKTAVPARRLKRQVEELLVYDLVILRCFGWLMTIPRKEKMDYKAFDILLIEDDADDAELTIHALKKYNLANRILHIDDGERALDFLFSPQDKPTLILLDLKMPRVDGIQILRRLKSDPAKANIPVVALISSKDGKNYLESFSVKADAYMIKPVDFKKFCAAVSEIGITSMILSSPKGGSQQDTV